MVQPTIIVTGASSGLGAATAELAARLGATVVLAARSLDALQERVRKIEAAGGRALALRANVSLAQDCRLVVRQTLEHFGRIDALVNNAGMIEPIDPIARARQRDWQRNWAVNVLGPVMLTKLALPHLLKSRGRVVNITSGSAETVVAGWGAYSSAKAAINHLTRVLASEEPSITALALLPGIVDTAMQAAIRDKGEAHMAQSNYDWLFNLHENGKLLPPNAPARSIVCLALYAPHEWSGEVLAWDENRLEQLVQKVFNF
jgi:NAD(P)-dependent dehydrogenase (short-subunit alcohol dehydrogenase family)